MNPLLPRRSWLVWGLAVLVDLPAQAAAVSRDTEKAVQAVVRAQLDAFARDDAKRAFALAAPDIRKQFGTAERFMTMVRVGYPVVHRSRNAVFLRPVMEDGELLQPVQLTDADGQVWLATYVMKRQKDKSWRIGGCTLVEDEGLAT